MRCTKWCWQWHSTQLCTPGSSPGLCLCTFINWCDTPCIIQVTLTGHICNVRCNCSICKHMQPWLYASSTGYEVGQLPKFVFRTCRMDVCRPCHHIFTLLTSNQGMMQCLAQKQFALMLEKAQRGRNCSLSWKFPLTLWPVLSPRSTYPFLQVELCASTHMFTAVSCGN